jgi:uncharacterized protein (TIGR00251 family)
MSDGFPDGLLSGTSEGTVIKLHLQPRASSTAICGIQGDELKVRVTAPPVDDAANRLCTEYFAKIFKTAKSNVTIISGHKSRHKKVQISGKRPADVSTVLESLL